MRGYARELRSCLGAASLAFSGLLLAAAPAKAGDYPGALWSVQIVELSGAQALDETLKARIRSGLRSANNAYFHGDRPVRMKVRVTGPDTMKITVVDARTGAVLLRSGATPMGADRDQITGTALAWMDGLQCAAVNCGEEQAAPTALAQAAPSTPVKAARETEPTFPQATVLARADKPARASARVASQPAKAKDPVATRVAPAEPKVALAGLESTRISRNPDLTGFAEPIRIARFDATGLNQISYADGDQLVLADPRQPVAAPSAIAAPATEPAPREDSTMIGRFFTSVASFLGFGGEPEPQRAVATARPAPAIVPASAPATAPASAPASAPATAPVTAPATVVDAAAPFTPSARWQNSAREPSQVQAAAPVETRVAALGSAATVPNPGTRSDVAPPPGLKVFLSPGLRMPVRSEEVASGATVTPIRFARATPRDRGAAGADQLKVKLDPEVLGRYSPKMAQRLFGSYGNRKAKVKLVADPSGRGGGSVDRILAARGLALASEDYARAERIFWEGNSGSRGFWISVPANVPARYVLVASSKASVIADVHQRGTRVRVSDAVAKALGLNQGDWSDVQVIALRQLGTSARRATGTKTR